MDDAEHASAGLAQALTVGIECPPQSWGGTTHGDHV